MSESPIIPGQTFTLFGEPLRAYSYSREIAANAMGMLYPDIGKTGAAMFAKKFTYNGILKDLSIVLWLCSIADASDIPQGNPDGQWSVDAAIQDPQKALSEAIQWAGDKGITQSDFEKCLEAKAVFISIVTKADAAKFTLVIPGAPANEADEGKV